MNRFRSLLKQPRLLQKSTSSSLKRGSEREKFSYSIGDQVHGFELKAIQAVEELNLNASLWSHIKTKAEALHIDAADTNNVFAVGFKTIPQDSTGVAHILEHTVLCGSAAYPVRDPFFNMLKRSLSTFMNAWTGNDFTMYPFSTQNPQDFSNLMSVYMDATFKPRLSELDFKQEGHRLEFASPLDSSSPLEFKGIVFNEMKGALSDPSSLFVTRLEQSLYPTNNYAYVSGGDPPYITDLTHQQLVDFHRRHYHPTNAKFYTYGDMPISTHFAAIDSVISGFEPQSESEQVPAVQPLAPRWTSPKSVNYTCSEENETKKAVAWLLNDSNDIHETTILSALSHLLTSGPNSPFYKSLIESGLGSKYSPYSGYDSSNRDSLFTIGVEGIKDEDLDKVESVIEETLIRAMKEGFPQDRIDAYFHQAELSKRHVTSNFGMNISVPITMLWLHGGDVLGSLTFNEHIARLKSDLASNPNLWADKISQYFVNNPHRLTITMKPSTTYLSDLAKEEAAKLSAIESSLGDSDRIQLVEDAKALMSAQEEEQDLDCLPTMRLSDIPVQSPYCPQVNYRTTPYGAIPAQISEQETRGVDYVRVKVSYDHLSAEQLAYLPYFTSLVTSVGAGELNHQDQASLLDLKTGGISVGRHIIKPIDSLSSFKQMITFSSHSLESNTNEMLRLLGDILTAPKFSNHSLILTLLSESYQQLRNSVASSGHNYAVRLAASQLSTAHSLVEAASGVSFVTEFGQLLSRISNDKEELAQFCNRLRSIGRDLFATSRAEFSVVTSKGREDAMLRQLDSWSRSLYGIDQERTHPVDIPNEALPTLKEKGLYAPMGFPVNYVAGSVAGLPYFDPDSPVLSVIAKILSTCYLHPEIREKGGAYGGGATVGSGSFDFYSYRDPNNERTVNIFENSFDWLLSNESSKWGDQDIDQAKLSLFSSIDSPVSPSGWASSEFINGITQEERQLYRERLLAVNMNDVLRVTTLLKDSPMSLAILGETPEQGSTNSFISKNPDWLSL